MAYPLRFARAGGVGRVRLVCRSHALGPPRSAAERRTTPAASRRLALALEGDVGLVEMPQGERRETALRWDGKGGGGGRILF